MEPANIVEFGGLSDLFTVGYRINLRRFEQENCGSVTPNVLTSLSPCIRSLESFGLGVSYSIKYDELLPFLADLKHLRHLKLFHYVVSLAVSLFYDAIVHIDLFSKRSRSTHDRRR